MLLGTAASHTIIVRLSYYHFHSMWTWDPWKSHCSNPYWSGPRPLHDMMSQPHLRLPTAIYYGCTAWEGMLGWGSLWIAMIWHISPAAIADKMLRSIVLSFWQSFHFYIFVVKLKNGLHQAIQLQYRDAELASPTVPDKGAATDAKLYILVVAPYLKRPCLEYVSMYTYGTSKNSCRRTDTVLILDCS